MRDKLFNAVPVKGKIHETNAKRGKDTFPFKPEIEGTPAFSVVSAPVSAPVGNESARPFHLEKLSRSHGRDLEVPEAKALWGDEFGNIYGSVNTKGNNVEHLEVRPSSQIPSGFKVNGLFEESFADRLAAVSYILRSHGIDTENIEYFIKPEELMVKGRRMTMPEVKKMLLLKAGENNEREHLDLKKVREYLDKEEFLFAIRSVQVSERIKDLEQEDGNTFEDFMKNIFSFINLRESVEAGRKGRDPEHFDAKNDEDVMRYLAEYFPERVAGNLAKLHSLGLSHGYPDNQNISMAGGLYDLDSVEGKAIDPEDKDITIARIRRDIDFLRMALGRMSRDIFRCKNQAWPGQTQDEILKKLKINFYKTYVDNAIDALVSRNIISPPPDFQEFEGRAIGMVAEEVMSGGRGLMNIPLHRLGEYSASLSRRTNDKFKEEIVNWLFSTIISDIADPKEPHSLEKEKDFWRENIVSDLAEKIISGSKRLSSEEAQALLMKKLEART